MISTKDYEKLCFLYQTEGAPKGVSINTFCKNNGINYEAFNDWLRMAHRAVCKVEVTGGSSDVSTDDGQDAAKDGARHDDMQAAGHHAHLVRLVGAWLNTFPGKITCSPDPLINTTHTF